MTGKHVYQILLSLLCILLAVLICSAAVGIYREGSRRKEEHPLETVFTKEAVEDASAHIAPLLIVTAVMAGGGILIGVGDERKVYPSGMKRNVRKDRQVSKTIVRAVLLTAAVVCIIAGIFNGGMQDVFVKAANICSECIGLG